MSWTDEEIDNLFREGASNQSFEYDNAYFSEIEAALPVNSKKKDFLWMGTALVFIAVLTTGYFVNTGTVTSFNDMNNPLAEAEWENDAINNQHKVGERSTVHQHTANGSLQLTDDNSDTDITNEASTTHSSGSTESDATAASYPNSSNKSGQQRMGQESSMYNLATRNTSRKISSADSNTTFDSNAAREGQDVVVQATDVRGNEANAINQKEAVGKIVPITGSLALNEVNQLDQGLNPLIAPNAIPLGLGELRPKAVVYAEMNAGVSQSLITPSESISRSFGAGLGVETHLGNFNLTTGVNFKASYHDDLFLSRKGKVYGFGSQEGRNTYDIRRIYSLEMPIMFGYNVGRHNFNVGVRPSLVVGAQTEHQAFENETLLRTEVENGLLYATVNGVEHEALLRFGLKPMIGYAYRMNKWTIGANVGVQLMQSVNEEVMDGLNNQLPIDGQIYLRRTIRLRR